MLDNNRRPRKRPSLKRVDPGHVIGVGSQVSVRDLGTGELDIYTLVLPIDADISQHWISTFTPLGGAVVGRKTGDVVEFTATVSASDDDDSFGFYSRPTKAHVLAAGIRRHA